MDDYKQRVSQTIFQIGEDVSHSHDVMAPFEEVLNKGRFTFCSEVDGHVKSVVGEFDKLLTYTPLPFFGWIGRSSNPILNGLDKAARLGAEIINNPDQQIQKECFVAKTEAIRKTLKEYYTRRIREEHKYIAKNISILIISNLQEIEKRLLEVMQIKYYRALELVMSQQVETEFKSRRSDLEERSRRLRSIIERIEQLFKEMSTILHNPDQMSHSRTQA